MLKIQCLCGHSVHTNILWPSVHSSSTAKLNTTSAGEVVSGTTKQLICILDVGVRASRKAEGVDEFEHRKQEPDRRRVQYRVQCAFHSSVEI